MADAKDKQTNRPKESMLASATMDRTPHVGIVLSSFRGGEEHDGTPIKGLTDPRPVDADLTDAQMDALLRKAVQVSGRRGGLGRSAGPEDWVVVKIVLTPEISTDVRLVRSLLGFLAEGKRGRRFTIATDAPADAANSELVASLASRYKDRRFEYVDLSTAPYLQVPAVRRTFAKNNPDGVYAIPKVIRECDQILTVTPMQTSPVTGVALSVSSYWSMAPTSVYGPQREKLMALGDPVDVLTDLYLHHPADYAIVGGSKHRDAAGNIVHHNIVIAGRGALPVDAVGAAVMGFDPAKLPLLDKLELRGFGVRDTDSIWTHGNEIDEARATFEKPANWRNA